MYIKKGDICKCKKDMDELVDLEEVSGPGFGRGFRPRYGRGFRPGFGNGFGFPFLTGALLGAALTPGYGYGYPYYPPYYPYY